MTDTTNHYLIFGGVLRTTFDLPELHPSSPESGVTWTLTVRDQAALPDAGIVATVREELAGGVSVRLDRLKSGAHRLTYSDTGTFDISADGCAIDWYRSPDARDDLARTDILGRVLSLATRANGVLMLHASAVVLNGSVTGFLAPKFYGKSTLACALTDNGAQLVTDDALAVRVRERVDCAPGVPAIRLRHEAARHLRGAPFTDGNQIGDWRHFERRERDEIMSDWLPLGALYVLHPRPSEEMQVAATRTTLVGAESAMALVAFAKLGGLLSGELAVDYLGHATAIASQVPICTLQYARDLGRLEEVAAEITNWHRD